jgi:hypothetical protein
VRYAVWLIFIKNIELLNSENKYLHRILFTTEGNRPPGKSKRRWEDNNKVDRK